jgi:hypothetical protein
MHSSNKKPEPTKTILTITIGLLIIYLVTKHIWLLNAAILIGVIGLLSEHIATRIDFLWMKLAGLLSLFMPTILLTAIFYLFLTPIALLSRLFGEKNQLKLKNTETSLFKECSKYFDKTSFEKTW